MKRLTKIIAGVTACVLSLGVVAGCAKNTNYPKFINNSENTGVKREKYNVRVLSEGGAKLDNVKVTVKKPDGTEVRRAISSNGLIELDLPLDEYALEVDTASLPAGYHLEKTTYKTSATARDDVEIKIPSRLIGANESGCTYSLGGIMKDFTFTDYRGNKHVLSDVLSRKSAVVINFWYTGCGPCRSEFPAIQRAYAMNTDVEIFAICSTHQGDTNSKVQDFSAELGLTFPAGIDDQGLITSFGVGSFPTTFVIDRYGMIAYRSVGSETKSSEWTNLFDRFSSDKYVQEITGGDNNGDDNNDTQLVKPNVTMPSSADMDVAASLSGSPLKASYRNDESEFSWPWLAGSDSEGTYIYSSNKGVGNSFSMVYAGDIEMKKDQVLMLEYKVDSEADRDLLHVYVDGIIVSERGYSAVKQWTSTIVYVADRDKKVELSFVFRKDPGDPDDFNGEDQAKVRNIHVAEKDTITQPTDILRTCASGGEVISGKKAMYEHYTNVVLGSDGFYHKGTADGPLVYITLSNITPWSDLHAGATQETDGTTYASSLYMMTYHKYADLSNNGFSVVFDGTDVTGTVLTYWSISSLMDYPYYLMPVTPKLKEWAEKFAERFEAERGSETHANEWLEFCYYYDHYGAEHKDCPVDTDHTRGLTVYNSYFAYEKGDPNLVASETYNANTGRNKAIVNFELDLNNGTFYKFTPLKTGIYNIRSYTKGCSSVEVSPALAIFDADDNYIESSQFVRDFDSKISKEEGRVNYEGFNHYVKLEKDVPVYLQLQVAPNATGYYDFEIDYLGTSFKKMYVASTYAGAWSSATRYSAIRVAYDKETDCYYKADRDGNPLYDQPIYISMTHESFLYSEFGYTDPITGKYEHSTYQSPEWLIEKGAFREMYGNPHAKMVEYLDKAKANVDGVKDEKGNPVNGLVKANAELVELLNQFIDEYVDGNNIGRGEGNAWLAFACYIEKFGD